MKSEFRESTRNLKVLMWGQEFM